MTTEKYKRALIEVYDLTEYQAEREVVRMILEKVNKGEAPILNITKDKITVEL